MKNTLDRNISMVDLKSQYTRLKSDIDNAITEVINQTNFIKGSALKNFEQELINLGFDNVLDDFVQTSNINTLTTIDLSSTSISDLTGIEDFSSLIELYCQDNQLSTIDVSNNINLEKLDCDANQLSVIDVTANINLKNLQCSFNNLSSLDVSSNPLLIFLFAGNNQIPTINVSSNPNLVNLTIPFNLFSSVDVSANYNLSVFDCKNNQISYLDVSNNTNLIALYCNNNLLTALDVTSNILLESLWCDDNQIPILNVTNNTAIKNLIIDNNNLTTIDVSTNILLELFFCQRNDLTSLDLSGNFMLQTIWCFDNQLTSLDIRNGNNQNIGTTLWDFDITGNYSLFCVDVDNPGWSMMNWTVNNDCIDSWNTFSSNCGNTSVIDKINTNKELLKVTDLVGRERNKNKNQPLFYIYDDGTVEKKTILE